MITAQILVTNNESTIAKCLDSLVDSQIEIVIGNLGSQDKTIEICKKYTNKIIDVSSYRDHSIARKNLIKLTENNSIIIMNPWEILFSGKDLLSNFKEDKKNFKISIIQGDVLTEEIRIVGKRGKYKICNPIFESIEGESSRLQIYLSSSGREDLDYYCKKIELWKKQNPLDLDPIYYSAFLSLTLKNWDNFINYAHVYIAKQKKLTMSKVMIHYYLAMVLIYIKKDFQQAAKNLVFCISKRPMMAEFWCLLGDLHLSINDFKKSKRFYEIALDLGSQRLNNDDWPVEISKYKTYPEKMIKSCEANLSSSKIYSPV